MKAKKSTRPKHSTSTPQSGHPPHRPQNSAATEAIPPLHHAAGRLHRRRTGKIARLTSGTRDFLNNLLRDGLPYSLIIKKLAERGHNISADNLSRWRSGGYQEWLHDQAWIEEMRLRFDFASKIARHKNVEDLDAAGLRIAVTQMYSLLTTFDPALLNPKIANHPGAYSRILNSLCKLTEAGIKCDHHRLAQPSKRASKIAPKPRSKRS